jgi:ATP-binding cassette, subfamily B, bacterial PglK
LKTLVQQVKISFSYFDSRSKIVIFLVVFLQFLLALLDVAGALGLGLIAIIAGASLTNTELPGYIAKVERFFGTDSQSQQSTLAVVGAVTLTFFVSKTIGSIYLNKKVLYFLARSQVKIAANVFTRLIKSDYVKVQKSPKQDLAHAITDSLHASLIGVLGNAILAMAEILLLFLLLGLLTFAYPAMAFFLVGIFGILAYVSQSKVGKATNLLNSEYGRSTVESRKSLIDGFAVLPEIKVSGRSDFFVRNFVRSRELAIRSYVRSLWLGQIPKYILEIGLVLAAFLLIMFGQLSTNSSESIGRLAIFLAVAGRLVPSMIRLQSEFINLQGNAGLAKPMNDLLLRFENLNSINLVHPVSQGTVKQSGDGLGPIKIETKDLEFSHENTPRSFQFGNIVIEAGSKVAVVGSSGVGKTTFVHLLLGLLNPIKGEVKIAGESPVSFLLSSNGRVSYLPQSVQIIEGTIAENIALGIDKEDIDIDKIHESLRVAALDGLVESFPKGIFTPLRESGSNLSGGQLQRIGIARAIYDQPGLIVLDEPTSSLDEETEAAFLSMLATLKNKTTFLIISHRMNLLKFVDEVVVIKGNHLLVSSEIVTKETYLGYRKENRD